MPFRSESQRRYLFAKVPAVAKRWAHKYGVARNLPEHVENKKKKPAKPRLA